jgi:hypothetical protein
MGLRAAGGFGGDGSAEIKTRKLNSLFMTGAASMTKFCLAVRHVAFEDVGLLDELAETPA